MGSSTKYMSLVFKVVFGAITIVGFIWLLMVGTLENEAAKEKATALTTSSKGNLKHVEGLGGGGDHHDHKVTHAHPEALDLNYMSKRRVPNGPDPIHNRCKQESRQLKCDLRILTSSAGGHYLRNEEFEPTTYRRAGNSRRPPGQA